MEFVNRISKNDAGDGGVKPGNSRISNSNGDDSGCTQLFQTQYIQCTQHTSSLKRYLFLKLQCQAFAVFQIEIQLTVHCRSLTQCRYEPVCDIKFFDVSNEEHTIHHWNAFFVASLKMIVADKSIYVVYNCTISFSLSSFFLSECESVSNFKIGMCTFLWTAHGK